MIHIPEPSHIEFGPRIAELKVAEIEPVTTDAGTFEAIKVVNEDRPKTSYRRQQNRSVVKMFFDSSVDTGRGPKRDIVLIQHGGAGATGTNKAPGEVAEKVEPQHGENPSLSSSTRDIALRYCSPQDLGRNNGNGALTNAREA